MALLQVHQAKTLRGHDPQVLQELRATTDLALRATKVTVRSVGRAMSTLVVQERHLWLCLADMGDTDKVRFLNSPVSQTGLFGDAVSPSSSPSSSWLYRSSLRRSVTSCHGGPLLHPLRRRQQFSLLVVKGYSLRLPMLPHRSSSLHPSGTVEPVVSGVPSPSRPPPRGVAKPRARGPRTGDPEMVGTALQEMVTALLLPPEEGRVVNPLFPFLSVLPLAQQPAVPKFSVKEQFLSSPGLKRARRVVGGAKPLHSHPPLLSPADSSVQFEKVTQASPAPPVRPWNQVSVAQHTQTLLRAASQREPPEPCPTSLPHCGYAYGPLGPVGVVSASLVSAPQSVSLAHSFLGMELDSVEQSACLTE